MKSLILYLLTMIVLLASSFSFAQSQNPSDLNITVGENRLRFTPTKPTVELRLEIVNSFRELVYGNVSVEAELQWNVRSNNDETLTPGLYAYTLTLKDVEGKVRQHKGNIIIEQSQDQIWLTTQDGADISGSEMTATRAGGRSIATPDGESSKRALSGRDVEDEKGNKLFDAKMQTDKLITAILGTPGKIVKFGAGGAADTDSIMAESGATVTTAGNLNVTGQYQINGQRAMLGVTGANNVFLGQFAGNAVTTGNHSMFLGIGAGQLATTGTNNMFIGPFSGGNTTSGVGNTYVGVLAGDKNTTGSNNVAIGSSANFANVSSGDTVAIGASAGLANLGGQNVFIGGFAGKSNTSGTSNTFVGINTDGAASLTNAGAIGSKAFVTASNALVLGSINGVNGATASTNVGIGTTAPGHRLDVAGTINTTTQYNLGGARILSNPGTGNLFAGINAGTANTTGIRNAYFGTNAGAANNNTDNTFFGFDAGASSTGGSNAFFGSGAGKVTTGAFNSFFGKDAGDVSTSGSANSFFGNSAGGGNTLGFGNTLIGLGAGIANTTGDNNTIMGRFADVGSNDLINATAIGFSAQVDASNSMVLGSINGVNGATADTNVGIGTTTPLDRLHVNGIIRVATLGAAGATDVCRNGNSQLSTCSSSMRYKDNILPLKSGLKLVSQLRPVTFDWKQDGSHDLGLVAEEVAAVAPLLTVYNDKGEVEGVKYRHLNVVLINAVKELQLQNNALRKRLETIERALVRKTRKR